MHSEIEKCTEGKPIPTELRREQHALRTEMEYEDEKTSGDEFLFYFLIQL
jgi:hypothetical protein